MTQPTLRQWLMVDLTLTRMMTSHKLATIWNTYHPEEATTQLQVVELMEDIVNPLPPDVLPIQH